MTEPGSPEVAVREPRRRRRHRARIVGAIVGVALIAGVATFVVLWNRGSSRPVSIEEARRRAGAPGTDQSAGAVPFRPAAGVYQGPDIPGTVTHLEGRCWRLRVDYSTNHWQSWDYCPAGSGLTENAGAFFQRLDLVVAKVDISSTYTCDPPVDAIRATQRAGDQWMQECRGTSTGSDGEVISSGPYTYVDPERLDIGGTKVAALHYHRLRNLTGGQTGTEDVNVWFDAATGRYGTSGSSPCTAVP